MRGERTIYTGERLRCVAMPLGGIGAGQVAIAGDGGLRQWQIWNQVNHQGHLPHSFFAAWARPDGGEATGRVLQSAALYDGADFSPAPHITDHLVPDASRELLAALPGVAEIEFVGEYPIAEVAYRDPALPVTVRLEAFSPFCPLDAEVSGLPAVAFDFAVTNPSDTPCEVALAAALQNGVGFDGEGVIDGVRWDGYGGNVNAAFAEDGLAGVAMTNAYLPADAAGNGSMGLFALSPQGEASVRARWDDPAELWADFTEDGRLAPSDDERPSERGRTVNGAVAVRATVGPGQTWRQTFVLCWHFPNRYVNFGQWYAGIQDKKSRFWLGNAYNNRFDSAVAVARAVRDDWGRLADVTRAFREAFYHSTLPYVVLDAVSSQASIVRSPTCLWLEDGTFHGFEGCHGGSTTHHAPMVGGCCPMDCTHVWNYEMAVARLFPALERTMRATELNVQLHPTGYLPHRVVLPLYLPRPWERPIGGPEKPALDGLLGAVLKTYREYLAHGDLEWLRAFWPRVRAILAHVMTVHDTDSDGVIKGEQPNTYDISIFGANSFIGSLYLAALRAGEEIAGRVGAAEQASEYFDRFSRGLENLDGTVWNGEYFEQKVDLAKYPEQQWASGCHSDQLLGQWWAKLLGLGYVLPPDHVRAALDAIVRHNFRERGGLQGFTQKPRVFASEDEAGLLVCTWPRGGRPDVPTQYSDEVWTGMEYEVAGLLLWEGRADDAFRLVRAVRERYDGARRNPWNEIECGDHYVRATSSFALLDAAAGFRQDAERRTLEFAPNVAPEEFAAFFVTGTAWGRYAQTDDGETLSARLEVVWGELPLSELTLEDVPGAADVSLDGEPVAFEWGQQRSHVRLAFEDGLVVRAGQTLAVTLTA